MAASSHSFLIATLAITDCHFGTTSVFSPTMSIDGRSGSYFTALPDGSVDRLGRWAVKWRDVYGGKPTFHLPEANPNLRKAYDTGLFDPPRDEPILLPLCGKTLDLVWLRDEAGHAAVCGVEGVEEAVRELRAESLPELREVRLPTVAVGGDGDGECILAWTTAPVAEDEFQSAHEGGDWFMAPNKVDGDDQGKGIISVVCADFFDLSASIFPAITLDDAEEYELLSESNADGPCFGSAFDRGALVAVPPSSRTQYVSKLDSLLRPGGKILLVTLDRKDNEVGPPFKVTPGIVEELFVPLGYVVDLLEEHPHDVKGEKSREFVFVVTKTSLAKGP